MPEEVSNEDVPCDDCVTVNDVLLQVEALQLTVEQLLRLVQFAVLMALFTILGLTLAALVFS